MPFVVQWRGTVARRRVDNQSVISAVDLLPTMCAMADVTVPAGLHCDGEDVSDMVLSGRARPRGKPLVWQWRFIIKDHVLHRSPSLAIRDGPWKLLMNPDASRMELYNIPLDPSELTNVADNEPTLASRLSQHALAWLKTLPPGPVDPAAGRNGFIPWP